MKPEYANWKACKLFSAIESGNKIALHDRLKTRKENHIDDER